MGKAKNTDLKITEIKRVSKKYDNTEKFEIPSGEYEGATITFQPLFAHTTIQQLLTEYQLLYLQAKEKEIELTLELQNSMLELLMVKYFTHFKKDIPNQLLGEGKEAGFLDYLDHFSKTGLLRMLIDNMFSPKETQKVVSALSDFLSHSLLLNDIEQQTQDKLSTLKLKNQSIFDELKKMEFNNKEVN